ncbi:MAG: Crp/Fnr family transcriptional regulator [Bacteroidota bacterium]|nr:Crp/Fnr family transcriptional regulator [Bacteroidota bacterium]
MILESTKNYTENGKRTAFLFDELQKIVLPQENARKKYNKGEVIFEEGNNATGIFCINSGKVKISKSGENGKEQIVRLSGKGMVIGYRALIGESSYKASATTLEESIITFIPKKIFIDLLDDIRFCKAMLKLLSQDLELSEVKQVDMATKPVKGRVAETLLLLKDTYGLQNDGLTLDVKIRREDIAKMVGAAKEVVIRMLAMFKESGIIGTNGRWITINKPEELYKVSIEHTI